MADPTPLRILIVDHEKAVVRSLKRALQKAAPEVEVLTAGSGAEALLVLSEQKPSGVLVDLDLRDLDPFELCRAVTRRPSLRGITLVTMAVGTSASVVARSQKAGAVRCLAKPVDPRELIAIFRMALALTHAS